MYVNHLITRNASVLAKIYTHSFNQELCAGTLRRDVFTSYLVQDALYLRDFSKALHVLANRFSDQPSKELFEHLSKEMIKAELKVHTNHLRRVERNTFFSSSPNILRPKTRVISDYTHHLLCSTNTAPLAEAVASCVPCFLVYKELGVQMKDYCAPDNPYNDWIRSYRSPKFVAATYSILEKLNELASQTNCPTSLEKINASFLSSLMYELHFFDTAHTIKDVPIIESPRLPTERIVTI